MTRYDDPHAYNRRWARLSPAEVTERSELDPLLFVADHISTAERGDGVLAVHVEMTDDRRLVVIVTPGPEAPIADQCRSAVVGIITRLVEEYGDPDDCTGMVPVLTLGLVVHRRGRPHVAPMDRCWAEALVAGCAYWDVEPLGVLVRTESGALVRVVLPIDPMAGRVPS